MHQLKGGSFMKNIFIEHYQKYPKMQISDFLKLLYQSCFGPKHLYQNHDFVTIHNYMEMELVKIKHESTTYIEDIGSGYLRIYLSAVRQKYISQEQLEQIFWDSMLDSFDLDQATDNFLEGIEILKELCEQKAILIPSQVAISEINAYLLDGVRPIHHSETYQKTYSPHYRVVSRKYLEMNGDAILKMLDM